MMESGVSTSSLTNILENTIENLLLAEQQVKDKETGHRDDKRFNLEKFWNDICIVAQKLSFECTKICLSFSKTPVPSPTETSSLLTALEQAVLALVSVFYSYSPACGKTLQLNLQIAVVYAIRASRFLLKKIKDEGTDEVAGMYHQPTGVVWQGCQKIEKCPRDNKAAVLFDISGQNELVTDALEEITEALKGDGSGMFGINVGEEEEDEKWTNEDKEIICPSVNLIKAAKIMFKRVMAAIEKNGKTDTEEEINQLDQLCEDCLPVSRTVDNLILELYPPLHLPNMEEQSHHLAGLVKTALKTMAQSHMATEAEQPHIEFVHKAVDHNLDKMKEILSHR